ncbi:amidohydrolase family protein [Sphingosinicella sp. CPCC 101087]|uniref:amidohydrolase family protein n=1 Tax=Sphingosinicella sp. CPCC 101087 TaxID=2497754 RepID=UPI00197F056B|nr:amidohydrolase family protein [Sphingosinicella sp. CPCC 101087]
MFATPAAAAGETVTAFVGCRIVPSAAGPAIEDGILVIRGARIEAVGSAREVEVPAAADRIDCAGGTLLPAFWNSHVHFMAPEWRNAGQLPADRLTAQLGEMLTGYGFAHVVDTGSDLSNTLALKRRIASGEVPGPSIISAGNAHVGANGTPYYITDAKLPELHGPAQARSVAAEAIRAGAGAVKLMSVSLTREQPFPSIPAETIRAAAEAAHAAGVQVLVHPTNRRGVELAIEGGADILLHTAPIGGPWDTTFAERIVRAGLSLVPTLKLWAYESAKENDPGRAQRFAEVSRQQVAAFRLAGGRILFGTDVGYMTDFDPTDEYVEMAAAGMSARDIIAALTDHPVQIFGSPERQGRLAAGHDADVVLLDGDPEKDVRAFSDVRATYRAGRRIYQRTSDLDPS